MGLRHQYICQGCGYEAFVSGDFDGGMIDFTVTITCGACKTLSDVGISNAEYAERSICSRWPTPCACGMPGRTRWTSGDPCPRCGAPMATGPMKRFTT